MLNLVKLGQITAMACDKAGAAEREADMGGTNLMSGGHMETAEERNRVGTINELAVAPVDRMVRINRAIVAHFLIYASFLFSQGF